MNKIKKQHYVPRFYLKHFSSDGEKLYVFDKTNLKMFETNIINIAQEKYFYDVNIELIDPINKQIIEKQLSKIESVFSDNLLEIIDFIENDKPLTHEQKVAISYYMFIQIFRTRSFRDELKQMTDITLKALADKFVQINFGESYFNGHIHVKEEVIALSQIKSLFMPEQINKFVNWFLNCIWIIGKNFTEEYLYTSDSPVIRQNPIKNIPNGWASPGVEIIFPLSSKCIITLYESKYYSWATEFDNKIINFTKNNVIHYNAAQVMNSHRQVFSPSGNFDIAIKVCNDIPDIRNPLRQKWSLS